jgi:tetratricopeptide (TPR) repeat protein
MKKSKDYKKILEEIYSSHAFERLDSFTDSKEWEYLNDEERELLSLLFVMQGEKQLIEGNNQVLESFRIANVISPNNSRILYRQGLAFSNQSQNLFCLKTACKIYESTLELQPDYFEAWHGLANSLVLIGTLNHDSLCLGEAINKYKQAEKFSDKIGTQKLAGFYRDLGLCWYSSGKLSGEPQDFRQALTLYQKCARLGLNTSFFWNDYGNAINEIAQLVNKPKLMIEAVEMYWKSIKLTPHYHPGWYNLATSLKVLYQIQPQEAYYAFANESFEQVSKLDPQNTNVWIKWGELQAYRGRIQRDIQNLKDSCKKFEVADVCDPNHSLVLSSWGEALLLIGSWTEDLEVLKEALRKIHKSLEIQKDNARLWFLYGSCLNELGKYYNEEKYFLDAIEKFQLGLQLDSNDTLLWYGIALSFFALGQLREDDALVYEASQYFMKAIESGGENMPQFWNDWGLALMRLSNMTDEKRYLESSINKFEQALRISSKGGTKDPNDVDWLYNLGCAYELLGDYEEETAIFEKAAHLFKKVLEIDPSFFTAYFNLACVSSRLGEVTGDIDFLFEANKNFEKALNYDPEDDQAWNEWGISLVNIAELIKDPLRPDLSQKFYAEAEKKFVFSAGLGNTSAAYHLACLYSLTGNFEASIHFLEKCMKDKALPPLDDLLVDDWLKNLRQTPLFISFLSQIERKDYQ